MNSNDIEKYLLAAPWLKFQQINSTNSFLLNLSDEKCQSGLTCSATVQTNGIGRKNRLWTSPPGGLYMSILVRPGQSVKQWPLISFVMACAGALSISKLHPDLDVRLKWPNDILINNRKVAGILLQSATGKRSRVVAGIGINVCMNPIQLPDRPLFPATVLDLESKYPASIDMLSQELRKQFVSLFAEYENNPLSIIKKWEDMSMMNNQIISIQTNADVITGAFKRITSNGALCLDAHGKISQFETGDIIDFKENSNADSR